ncbi:cyclin-L1-1-like, partial [Macadamia integrifolia]|uniref:cyclin-L1-1-like n=1 Tax=Macadamia integrifolia TaxID=60698 RepID=UPI001C4F77C9
FFLAWIILSSLRTTLCVRFKSEVVACGVVYAAAQRFQVPLPENPPWWKAFDTDKSGIDEVCRVLAHLYSIPKAQYIPVCKEGDSFTTSRPALDLQAQKFSKEDMQNGPAANNDTSTPKVASAVSNPDPGGSKGVIAKAALDKLKESKKGDDDTKSVPIDGEMREPPLKSKAEHRQEASGEKSRERERSKGWERDRGRDGRDSDREKEREKEVERRREKVKDRTHRSKDKGKDSGGHSEKSRHHPSRDRSNRHSSSYSSREKDRHRHHPYA